MSAATFTYSFSEPLEYRVSGFTVRSAFVLNETGGFYLAYEAFAHRYQGRYERDDGQISFYFSEQSRAAADAIGTLKGNLLEVRYSEMMQQFRFRERRVSTR